MTTMFDYNGELLRLVTHRYSSNGSLAVTAMTADGEPFATLSVNMPDASDSLPDDVFYLKTWSENAMVAAAAIAARVIERVPGIPTAYSGFISADAYRLVG